MPGNSKHNFVHNCRPSGTFRANTTSKQQQSMCNLHHTNTYVNTYNQPYAGWEAIFSWSGAPPHTAASCQPRLHFAAPFCIMQFTTQHTYNVSSAQPFVSRHCLSQVTKQRWQHLHSDVTGKEQNMSYQPTLHHRVHLAGDPRPLPATTANPAAPAACAATCLQHACS